MNYSMQYKEAGSDVDALEALLFQIELEAEYLPCGANTQWRNKVIFKIAWLKGETD